MMNCSEVRLACHNGHAFFVHVALTPPQVHLIKKSFSEISHNKERMGELFYERLFEVAPETRNMFPDDLTRQKEKFAQMLDIFVSRLDHSNFITDEIQDLGRRHVLYNVHAEHYNIVGDVILWMLERMLGHSFTPDVKLAWASAYETLSYVMQQNAQTTLSKEKSLDRMIKGGMVATYGLDDNLNLKSGND